MCLEICGQCLLKSQKPEELLNPISGDHVSWASMPQVLLLVMWQQDNQSCTQKPCKYALCNTYIQNCPYFSTNLLECGIFFPDYMGVCAAFDGCKLDFFFFHQPCPFSKYAFLSPPLLPSHTALGDVPKWALSGPWMKPASQSTWLAAPPSARSWVPCTPKSAATPKWGSKPGSGQW